MADAEIQRQLGALVESNKGLARSVDGLRDELKTNTKAVHDNGERLAAVETQCSAIQEQVTRISRVTTEGNGTPPLTERVTRLEEKTDGHDDEIVGLRGKCNAAETARTLSRGQVIVGSLAMLGTFITALVAAAAALWKD